MLDSLNSKVVFRLFPTPPMEELFSVLNQYQGAVDELWFCSLTGNPELEKHRAHAKQLSKWAREAERRGLTPGLQIANTIGHGGQIVGENTAGEKFGRMMDLSGKIESFCSCPRDPAFLAYVRELCLIYASEMKPASMWLDDDLRMNLHAAVEYGCACPRCLAEFNRLTHGHFTREELYERLNAPGHVEALRRQWIDFCSDAMAQVAGACAAGAAASGVQLLMGLQECGLEWAEYNGYTLTNVLRAMNRETGLPVGRRPGSGNYTDHEPRNVLRKLLMIARESADRDPCCPVITAEVENYPHAVQGKSPLGTVMEGSAYLAAGCNSLSFVLTSTLNQEPPELIGRMLSKIAQWRPYWEKMIDVNRNSHLCGFNLWRSRNYAVRALRPEEARPGAWGHLAFDALAPFLTTGLPISAHDGASPAVILTAQSASAISAEEWSELKKQGILLDADTVRELNRRHLIDDWRIEVLDVSGAARDLNTDDALNAGMSGEGFMLAGTCYALRLGLPGDWRILSRVTSMIDGSAIGAGIALRALPEGGKVAILGYAGWTPLLTSAKRRQLLRIADELWPGGLPTVLNTPAQVVVLQNMDARNQVTGITLLNASIDETLPLELELRGMPEAAFLWHIPGEESIRPKELSSDRPGTRRIALPALAGWHVGSLEIERSKEHKMI